MAEPPFWVPVLVVDREFWDASLLFNSNAFVPHLRASAMAAGQKLALVSSAVIAARSAAPDASAFMRLIRVEPAMQGNPPAEGARGVALYYRPHLLNAVHACLVAAKSFLDLHAVLISRALVERSTIDGFHRAGDVIGGRFLKWLNGSVSATTYPRRDDLVALIEKARADWIQEAVVLRDQAIHWGGLQGWRDMQVPLDRDVNHLSVDQVLGPAMPDGTPPVTWLETLELRLKTFAQETLALLPDSARGDPATGGSA